MDILKAAGDSQLCAGHISGCEAGVHAMTDTQVDDQTEAVLLIDASNDFNFLNREAAMKNIQSLCPPLAKIVVNTYVLLQRTSLHRWGGHPLTRKDYPRGSPGHVYQCYSHYPTHLYADNASVGGKLDNLRSWWNKIQEVGPLFG